MDIAGVSTALSQASVLSRVGTAVLGKAMEADEELGAGLVRMMDASAAAMELSVNPGVGANFDMRV